MWCDLSRTLVSNLSQRLGDFDLQIQAYLWKPSEINARVKNSTDRTISGLEMRGVVVDEQGATAGERAIIVIPRRQPSLQPGETMEVRILVEGISRKAKSLTARMEVTGVRFN